jgi:Tfp pilus assembly PilM family ATPase
VIVVGATPDRRNVEAKAVLDLPAGVLNADLKASNFDRAKLAPVVRQALDLAGFSGSEIVLVIPDDATRVSVMNVDSFPDEQAAQRSFILWKLKKSVPFEVDTAQLAYRKLGQNGTIDLLVVLSPRSVTSQYEDLMESMGLHAGILSPSTTAAFNLMELGGGDTLFVKLGPSSITTSVFVEGRLKFYRKVARQPIYEAVYPTIMYYQDKLGGSHIRQLIVCGYDSDTPVADMDLSKLALPVRQLHSSDLEDMYKPALGALQW